MGLEVNLQIKDGNRMETEMEMKTKMEASPVVDHCILQQCNQIADHPIPKY